MIDPKLLTENGWKGIALKFKVKDNGLQRALAAYEDLEDDEHEDRIEGIDSVSKLAGALKRAREVAAAPEVVEYLDDIVSAAESEKREITKAKAAADKAEAASQKKAVAGANKAGEDEDEEEEEEEDEDYSAKLLAAFQKLKGAKDLSYQFIVCDAKPHCALMVAKRITPKHKQELTKITGGSKRFLHVGTCHFEDGRFTFTMEKPVTGLARKLQDSIKNFTSKKLPIKVGTESAEDEEGPPDSERTRVAGAEERAFPPVSAKLAKAPGAWRATQSSVTAGVRQLQAAVRKSLQGEAPALVAEIEEHVAALDGIAEMLGNELPDILKRAVAAKDVGSRNAELKNAKTLLMGYLKYANGQGAELIGHIDSNPFGVKTNLKKTLTDGLTQMAEAIGTPA